MMHQPTNTEVYRTYAATLYDTLDLPAADVGVGAEFFRAGKATIVPGADRIKDDGWTNMSCNGYLPPGRRFFVQGLLMVPWCADAPDESAVESFQAAAAWYRRHATLTWFLGHTPYSNYRAYEVLSNVRPYDAREVDLLRSIATAEGRRRAPGATPLGACLPREARDVRVKGREVVIESMEEFRFELAPTNPHLPITLRLFLVGQRADRITG